MFLPWTWGFTPKVLRVSAQVHFTRLVVLQSILNKTEILDFPPIPCCCRCSHMKKSNQHCGLKTFGIIGRVFLMSKTFFRAPFGGDCFLWCGVGFFFSPKCRFSSRLPLYSAAFLSLYARWAVVGVLLFLRKRTCSMSAILGEFMFADCCFKLGKSFWATWLSWHLI